MPRPIFRIYIVAFWLTMTAWLINADVLPHLGYGDVGFRSVLEQRAVDETARWRIELESDEIGSASTTIKPNMDGSFTIINGIRLDVAAFLPAGDSKRNKVVDRVRVDSRISVDALRRLDSLEITLVFPGMSDEILITGTVEDDQLNLILAGFENIPGIPTRFKIPVDRESLFADKFVPLDKLPDLRIGAKWTSRSVNPFAAVSGPFRWLMGGQSIEVTLNEVTQFETIAFQNKLVECFVIEHRSDDRVSKTWARKSDGIVLKRHVSFAGKTIAFILDPDIETE